MTKTARKKSFSARMKWACLCIFCAGLILSFVQTDTQRAQNYFDSGMVFLSAAQAQQLSEETKESYLGAAQDAFLLALKTDMSLGKGWQALGHTYQQSGRSEEARQAYNVAVLLGAREDDLKTAPAYHVAFADLKSLALR